jgi:amino acid permease
LVLFIGWVGSKVVSSNLAPLKITAHMVLAMLLSFVLVGTYELTFANRQLEKNKNKFDLPEPQYHFKNVYSLEHNLQTCFDFHRVSLL